MGEEHPQAARFRTIGQLIEALDNGPSEETEWIWEVLPELLDAVEDFFDELCWDQGTAWAACCWIGSQLLFLLVDCEKVNEDEAAAAGDDFSPLVKRNLVERAAAIVELMGRIAKVMLRLEGLPPIDRDALLKIVDADPTTRRAWASRALLE